MHDFFQAGPGGYGEGDRFLGITVPAIRTVARAGRDASLSVAITLLRSEWHEERLLALILMVRMSERGDAEVRQRVFDEYLANIRHVDNWDLVNTSAPTIVGGHVARDDIGVLVRLAEAASPWQRRIAMLATLHHIRQREFAPALQIAALLRQDPHPMLHKAVGWMLKEIGERDRAVALHFLDAHWRTMPRTAVRYAIEKFPAALRRRFMAPGAASVR